MDDLRLGRQIGSLLASRPSSSGPDTTLLAHVQDLLGADSSLLLPLRDLLARPAFRQLRRSDSPAQRLAGRDGLIADLLLTYQPAVVERLSRVLDGMLDLPLDSRPVPSPALPAAAASIPAGEGPRSKPGRGVSPSLLILLASLATGGVLAGLGWWLLSARDGIAPLAASASTPSGLPSPDQPPSRPAAVALKRRAPTDPGTHWGEAASYKHGTLPSSDYPQTCAFSRSDASGANVTALGRMELWACRDLGGDPTRGIGIRWSDGQETTYRFEPGGGGSVTGTEGETYPIRWRNGDHQGQPIIVIEHQDQGESWIPGRLVQTAR